MKKNYLLTLAIIVLAVSSNAQQWKEAVLGSSSTINFYEAQKRADVYFKEVKEEIQKEGRSSSEEEFEGKKSPMHRAYFEYQRWERENIVLVKEDGSLGSPIEAYNAYKAYSDNASTGTRAGITANWKNINRTVSPGGYFGIGMATCVQFHPTDVNTFWVSSGDAGGLWKTTNGGNSYTPIGDNLPWLKVGSFCVDPTNTNVIYTCSGYYLSCCGDRSTGVYKTTDGGVTWNSAGLNANLVDNVQYSTLVMSPTNPKVLLVGGLTNNVQGIFRTTDGGTTWTNVLAGQTIKNLAFKPGDGNIIYAAAQSNNGAIYRSTDAGLTWSVVQTFSNGYTDAIACSPVNKAYVAMQHVDNTDTHTMWVSTNSGATWVQKSTLGKGYVYRNMVFSAYDANTIYMGFFELFKSTDLGATFGPHITAYCCGTSTVVETHADFRDMKVNPLDKKIYLATDGGLSIFDESVTPYGTASWKDKSSGLIITNYLSIASSPVDPKVYGGGGMDNGFFVRKTNGAWINADGGDGGCLVYDPFDVNTFYCAGGVINRSTNGSWNNVTNVSANIPASAGTFGYWLAIDKMAADPNNPNTIVTGQYKDVWRSTNKGDTWTKIGSDLVGGGTNLAGVAIAPSNSNVIYTHYLNNLYVTKNGGTSWSSYKLNTGAGDDIMGVAISSTQPGTIWVGQNQWLAGKKVYKSVDYGATFTNETGSLPNMSVSSILYDKSTDGVYVSMYYGIYYKNSTMSDWVNFSQGLPNAQVVCMSIQDNAKVLRCGTSGRGMWETDLYSTTGVTNCTAGADFATYEHIQRVQFGYIDNTSAATTYSDFTGKSTSALRGSTMNMTVTLGMQYPADTVLVWCDWNNDKIFDETTELAATLKSTGGANPYTGSIKIPANAFLGKIKMRIRMFDTANQPTNYTPCGNAGYGEVEDYTLKCTDNVTSIDEADADNKPLINVYPTPIKDAFTLDISFPDNGIYKLEIANTLGQIVYSEALEINNRNYNYNKKLNLGDLSKGIYIIHLSGDKTNTTKKIIME